MIKRSALPSAEVTASPHVFAGFGIMCFGMFMAILDVQIVATSLPTIQKAVGIAPDDMSWVQTGYLIAEVVAIPLTGFLTRLLGMRWLFSGAILAFSLASLGCAASTGFTELIIWRVLQGFSGGTLIPAVFASVFLLFPVRLQGTATTIAGALAVLAPTVGPIAGGWITETYSWHWLFMINVGPGLIAAILGLAWLPREPADWRLLKQFDSSSLILLATGLATLEIALKQAPHDGWVSPLIITLLTWTALAGMILVRRTLSAERRLIDLTLLSDRNFAIGSVLSFILGIGLYGSVYLMPLFLAYVRGHSALAIGEIMLVTGIAQLVTAPVAVALERRFDARLLTAFGFTLLAVGLGLSAHQTINTDFQGMFWPQVFRGIAIMFCLLPPTRLALGHLPAERVPDASALFNLMRNLGGAIGLALIDTIIYGLAPAHGNAILAHLQTGDVATAIAIGIPPSMMTAGPAALGDPSVRALVAPLIDKAAFVETSNLAWASIATVSIVTLAVLPFIRSATAMSEEAPSIPARRHMSHEKA
ncbi:DHA2 family efflux MFS transporter permease subunit [Pseudorhodoplanes sinuspersici]|uniref:MFS transporter n=1 Tax=Pseudorhodoplanes sinuspersici TaxID=1235591 RepID=A0A1W6ZSF9_9HYPH|nr:DHA2 family efflux MFS transporter permease subunit [Pseudorhodoplanes sinuspersici]ARQ00302.1 MFS transporter [Pseudorhodoplanes sinuspersici]RKE67542.1 DHA2 family multidrug resistance protein [Pseudorhodoplanes sinuspersici]